MLTQKQQKFIDAYDGHGTRAAQIAGYKLPAIAATENLRKPKIIQALQEKRERENRPLVMSRIERQEFWSRIIMDESANLRDRLRASELLGRSEMDFTERIQHEADVELRISWAG